MKYFLLAILAMVGCGGSIYNSTPFSLPEPPSSNQTVIGFNDNTDLSFSCLQSEVTPALVWDECNFHNFSTTASKAMCIQVSYNLMIPVAPVLVEVGKSQTVCSGLVAPGDTKTSYVAFTFKNGRQELEKYCGPNMIQCKMAAQEVKQ